MPLNNLKDSSITTIEDLREEYPNGLVQDLGEYIEVSNNGKKICYLKDGDNVKPLTFEGLNASEDLDIEYIDSEQEFLVLKASKWPALHMAGIIKYNPSGELTGYEFNGNLVSFLNRGKDSQGEVLATLLRKENDAIQIGYGLCVNNQVKPFHIGDEDVSFSIDGISKTRSWFNGRDDGYTVEYKGRSFYYDSKTAQLECEKEGDLILVPKGKRGETTSMYIYEDIGEELQFKGSALKIGNDLSFFYAGEKDISKDVKRVEILPDHCSSPFLEYKGACVSFDETNGKLKEFGGLFIGEIFSDEECDRVMLFDDTSDRLEKKGEVLRKDDSLEALHMGGKKVFKNIEITPSRNLVRFDNSHDYEFPYDPETLEIPHIKYNGKAFLCSNEKEYYFYTGDDLVYVHDKIILSELGKVQQEEVKDKTKKKAKKIVNK